MISGELQMGIAIITGASSGIGKEFAVQLDTTENYDEIWLIARSEDRLKQLGETLSTTCKVIPLDLEDEDAIDSLENLLNESGEDVNICVNSAGFGLNGDFRELSREEQLQMIDLNCRSVVQLSHLLIPFMPKGAHFINISSSAGAAPLGAFAIYGASKSFVTSFSYGLAAELHQLGIGMTIVTPGSVDTDFQKRSRGSCNRKKKLFSKKATAEEIVTEALKDMKRGKMISAFGFSAKLSLFLGKVLSHSYVANLAYTKIYPKK